MDACHQQRVPPPKKTNKQTNKLEDFSGLSWPTINNQSQFRTVFEECSVLLFNTSWSSKSTDLLSRCVNESCQDEQHHFVVHTGNVKKDPPSGSQNYWLQSNDTAVPSRWRSHCPTIDVNQRHWEDCKNWKGAGRSFASRPKCLNRLKVR